MSSLLCRKCFRAVEHIVCFIRSNTPFSSGGCGIAHKEAVGIPCRQNRWKSLLVATPSVRRGGSMYYAVELREVPGILAAKFFGVIRCKYAGMHAGD